MIIDTFSTFIHFAKLLFASLVFVFVSLLSRHGPPYLTFLCLDLKHIRLPLPLLSPPLLWSLLRRCSPFWLFRQCRDTRRSIAVMAKHRKYGDFVRIAPNHISIDYPAAVDDIYGRKSGCTKSKIYDAFVQVKPNLFNARDVGYLQRKRKYLNPAFSARALGGFEEVMDGELRKWKSRLLEKTEKGPAQVDFAVWCECLLYYIVIRPMIDSATKQITSLSMSSDNLPMDSPLDSLRTDMTHTASLTPLTEVASFSTPLGLYRSGFALVSA